MFGDIRSLLLKPKPDENAVVEDFNALAALLDGAPQEWHDYALGVGNFHRERWLEVGSAYAHDMPTNAIQDGDAWRTVTHAVCDLAAALCDDLRMDALYMDVIEAVREYSDAADADEVTRAEDAPRLARQHLQSFEEGVDYSPAELRCDWTVDTLATIDLRPSVSHIISSRIMMYGNITTFGQTMPYRNWVHRGINQHIRECLLHYVRTGEVRR